MAHGYKSILGDERIETRLFQTGNTVFDAVMTDWFFGSASQGSISITGAGNIATAEAIGSLALMLLLTSAGIVSTEAQGSPAIAVSIASIGIISVESTGFLDALLWVATSGVVGNEVIGSSDITAVLAPLSVLPEEQSGSPNIGLALIPLGIVSSEGIGLSCVNIRNSFLIYNSRCIKVRRKRKR